MCYSYMPNAMEHNNLEAPKMEGVTSASSFHGVSLAKNTMLKYLKI